jgi:glycerophosphoryl diester phosphodiesterase
MNERIRELAEQAGDDGKWEPKIFRQYSFSGDLISIKIQRTKDGELEVIHPRVDETAKDEHEFECPRCGHCCREWVGLTDGEILKLWGSYFPRAMEFYQAIEDKLKEKNCG